VKLFFSLFALFAIALAVYPFVFRDEHGAEKVEGLPWQISRRDDGAIEVFGLIPGESTLADAIATLGDDAELAIITARDETGELEMYYGHYRAGLISGKMILQADASDSQLAQWKREAVKVAYMPSGTARKYLLDSDSLPQILQTAITGITFIPAINLDEAIILARFGQPERVLRVNAHLVHYLYRPMGLDIALSDGQKDVLQYVRPDDFDRLEQPLLSK